MENIIRRLYGFKIRTTATAMESNGHNPTATSCQFFLVIDDGLGFKSLTSTRVAYTMKETPAQVFLSHASTDNDAATILQDLVQLVSLAKINGVRVTGSRQGEDCRWRLARSK